MKKLLLFALLLAALSLFLFSCDLLEEFKEFVPAVTAPTTAPVTTNAPGTTVPTPTTEAPTATTVPPVTEAPVTEAPLPTVAELNAAIDAAVPTRAEATVIASYTSPEVSLTTEILFLHSDEGDYYTYRTEYLLSMEEAISAGTPVGERSGYLKFFDSTIVSHSPDVTAEILAAIPSLSCRLPRLDAFCFSTHTVKRSNGSLILTASAKDDYITMLYDSSAEGITGLTITLTFDEDTLRPTSTALVFTAADGAAVTYTAAYSYTAVVLPD